MKYILPFIILSVLVLSCKEDEPITTVTDIDNNVYNIVTIGDQIWMAENLKTTRYADGSEIPNVTNEVNWLELGDNNTDKAYCFYNNQTEMFNAYGALYTWAAAMNGALSSNETPSQIQGACPNGWHLPSDDEWTALTATVAADHYPDISNALKAKSVWDEADIGDDYGFSALPGGRVNIDQDLDFFLGEGEHTTWWSSTQSSETTIYTYQLDKGWNDLFRAIHSNKSSGFYIRCIRD